MWLIVCFIDEILDFFYVLLGDVLCFVCDIGVILYDVLGVELLYVGELCSFDVFFDKYWFGDDLVL